MKRSRPIKQPKDMLLRSIPPRDRQYFKAWCKKRNFAMYATILSFMRLCYTDKLDVVALGIDGRTSRQKRVYKFRD